MPKKTRKKIKLNFFKPYKNSKVLIINTLDTNTIIFYIFYIRCIKISCIFENNY